MSTNEFPTDPNAETIGLPTDDSGKGTVPEPGKYVTQGIPSEIGRYRILGTIASGGMGVVYEAMQEAPRRRVALKIIKAGAASDMALHRFHFEAQTLAKLSHPNIAQIYEAGTWESENGEVPFFAMEYISGAQSLTDYAKRRDMSLRDRLELFGKVCDAVHHGHQKGVIHRDLKPDNILVDNNGEPKIIDFGVARATDADLAVTTMETTMGQLIGTLQYMSPEQCDADPNDIDIRSDVYALGVVLYELLCDQLPYALHHAAIHEAARVIREEDPTKPSAVDKRLRGDIDTIAMKALEKDRDRRYQSALSLGDDIDRYLLGDPIAARAPSAIDYLKRFARKHKAAVTSVVAVCIVLVGGLIGIFVFAAEANTQKRIATKAILEARSITQALNIEPRVLDEFTGGYFFPSGVEFVLDRPGHQLMARLPEQESFPLYDNGRDRFLFLRTVNPNAPAELTFGRNRRGEVERVVLHQNGLHQEALKRGHGPESAEVVDLGEYIGDYRFTKDESVSVSRSDKGISIKVSGHEEVMLVQVGRDRFEAQAANWQLSFLRDSDGQVDRLILHLHDDHHEAAKQP